MTRLTIELNDDDVKIKLDDLIGERVKKITDDFINEKVSKIVDTKLQRLNIDNVIRDAALSMLKESHGEPKNYSSKYAALLRDEACKLLTKQFELTKLNT